jgi:hypothetical protein
MKKNSTVLFSIKKILMLFTFMMCANIHAQMSNFISSVKTGDAKDKSPLTISADLISPEAISAINIAFRSFGENEYKKMEMLMAGISASGTIPGENIQPPFIEYYLIIDLKDGTSQTFPVDIEQGGSPVQVAVAGLSEKDSEIMVLSPADGETITSEDFLISVSFFKAPSNVEVSKTKIYLNGEDVSSKMLLAGDLIIISSENFDEIQTGAKSLKVEIYDTEGNVYHTINKSFQVVTQQVAEQLASNWKYYGNLKAESRSETYSSESTWYNNFNADLSASNEYWKFNGYAYFTSEEKKDRQPYNRYSASVKGSDWLELNVGDAYPQFPSLIMEGKRVRGASGALNFGAFNLQASAGEIVRKIEGTVLETYTPENAPLSSDVISINNGTEYAKVNLGTYSRQIFAIRPSFGSGENFQLGFSYLHAKDDPGSIKYSTRPQENAVFGTDLMFAFDEQNITFTSQAAISLFNKDISSGNLTDAQIDSLFGPGKYIDMDPNDVKTIRDIAGSFITVNQYIGPLNPQELASLAAEGAVNINYFNNSLKASYIYRGNDYQSFGQTFIRTDVKGINVVDRIRMIDNKVFISLGYESLKDNLQKTKVATTTYQTVSASLSIFPRADFPNITLGYNNYDNSNSISVKDTVNNDYMVDESTNRFMLSLSYDIVMGVWHNTSLSFSTQNRDDNSLSNADAKFNSGIFSVNSYWDMNLSSTFQMIYSSTEISGVPFDYFTLVAGAKYKMLEDKLSLSASLSPSFGDFKRQAFEFLADYRIIQNFNLAFQTRIFRFPGKSTNSIIGLTTRYSF